MAREHEPLRFRLDQPNERVHLTCGTCGEYLGWVPPEDERRASVIAHQLRDCFMTLLVRVAQLEARS